MIEEIKKEIDKKYQENNKPIIASRRCQFARKNETIGESKARRNGFLSGLLIAKNIIDKYNNQSDYKSAFEELHKEVREQINLLQNWCGDCDVCINIPKPKEQIDYSDLNDKLQELEEKYDLGGD